MAIQKLRERRARASAKLHDMFPKGEDGDLLPVSDENPWTDEEQKKYDALTAEVRECDAQIKRYNDMVDAIGKGIHERQIKEASDDNNISIDEATANQQRFNAAFTKFLRHGESKLDEKDFEILNALGADALRRDGTDAPHPACSHHDEGTW